jgi:hypothetical protein
MKFILMLLLQTCVRPKITASDFQERVKTNPDRAAEARYCFSASA